ncbi:hypothetical protein AAG906_018296 [Vitis piasezkii]
MSNNLDPNDPIEFSPVQYHSAPSLQFENVENIGNAVSKFMVGQVFNSKADLQHVVKLYSISSHQEYVVVESTTKLLIFQRVFWTFHPSIKGFKHCQLVLSIDGTHLYGKYKGTLMIVMGCDGNNQLFPLAFALREDQHPGIMAAMSDLHLAAQQWLEAIPFEKWAFSHDGGQRYGIMTTNMSEVFNSVLKMACSLPITALVQLTFFRLNSYFVVRMEQGANLLASNEEYTPYVDAKIKANVVKVGSHEIVLYDHIRGQFHVKTNKAYRINLQEYARTCGKTLIYGFPCSHILAACHFCSVDFRPLVQHYYSTQSYYNSWAPLFHPSFNVYEWPPYDGPIIVPSKSMKRASSGRPKSSRLHNEMDVSGGKTSITYMEYKGQSSDPDSLDTSVLVLQDRHIYYLTDIFVFLQLASILTCRQHISRFMREWEMDFRLRIHGLPITGTCDIDWSLLCYELLGVTLPTSQIRGSAISTRWLCYQFSHPPVDLDDATLERYARAFILGLIGSALFIDNKDLTQTSMYSWATRLAHLYRELCQASLDGATDIVGCVTLLQRLHVGRPILVDHQPSKEPKDLEHDAPMIYQIEKLDHGLQDEALLHKGLPTDPLRCRWRVPLSWAQNPSREPYMGDLVTHLSAISLADQEILQTMSPLICFDIVEWPRPERLDLHSVDRRGRHKYDWGAFHAQYITLWGSREERIATAPPMWYRHITRRLITPPLHRDQMRYHSKAAASQLLITGMVEIASDIHRIVIDILHVIGEEHRIHSLHQSPTSSYPSMSPPVSTTTVVYEIMGELVDSLDDLCIHLRPKASTLPHSPLPSPSPRPSSLGHVVSDTTLPSPVFPTTEATIPDVTIPETTPVSTSLPSPLPSLEETTTPHVTSPSSLISPLLKPTIPDVILPFPISPLLDATISDITVPEIAPPSTTLPSPTHLPIETTMHHTFTHVTQLDVCPPRRRRGPRRHRVLPLSAPSQPIHTETWQIAQIDSTEMSLYHRRPQRKRKTPSCGTH